MLKDYSNANIDSDFLSSLEDDELDELLDSIEEDDSEDMENSESANLSNLNSIINEITLMANPCEEIRKEKEEIDKDLEPDFYEDLDDELLDLDF